MSGHAEIMRTAMKGLGVHSSNGLVTTSMAMMWMAPSQKQGYFSFLAILVTKTT
ncbi:hypothetical protein NC651_034858 [Populus alba x Populus x berolinensis]|nr:hypothetical protein NC651_034858 [Populus alba x Populus x berolinensis]